MTLNPSIFRRYDIRGIVQRDLTPDLVRALGCALGTRARRNNATTFALARDARLHSPMLRDALVEGLLETGLEVLDLGLVPTPLLYFSVFHWELGGGVMITGSHNPPEFNGFKMMVGRETIHSEAIQELRAMIEAGEVDRAPGGSVREVDVVEAYTAFVTGDIALGPQPQGRPLRVVVDGGNGAGGFIAEPLLKALGVDVVGMYLEPDGHFPNHHPDPTEAKNVVDLIEAVKREGADLGVAYDGDGDRIGVVDERGEIVWGDKLLIVLARALLREVPGATVVGEVKCSQTLYDDIEAHGGRGIMWRVGHSLIKTKMIEEGALLAGEMSGHIFYKHRFFGFDDAIYTTARLIEIVSHHDGPMSSLLDGVPETWATPELRLEVDDAQKFDIAARVAARFEAEGRDVVTLDGVRVRFDDGWGLVRASNTQPALVLRAEAQSPQRRDAIERLLRDAIDEAASSL